MQADTQSSLFKEKILKSSPSQLTLKGFECVKTFFESVNVSDNKMKKTGTQTVTNHNKPLRSVVYLYYLFYRAWRNSILSEQIFSGKLH